MIPLGLSCNIFFIERQKMINTEYECDCGCNQIVAAETMWDYKGKHKVLFVVTACCAECLKPIVISDMTLAEFLKLPNTQSDNCDLICPKCRSELIIKENKFTGDVFLGCSQFPKCTHTQ